MALTATLFQVSIANYCGRNIQLPFTFYFNGSKGKTKKLNRKFLKKSLIHIHSQKNCTFAILSGAQTANYCIFNYVKK
jgi:hypothetical protein